MVKALCILLLSAFACLAQPDPGVDPAYLANFLGEELELTNQLIAWWNFDQSPPPMQDLMSNAYPLTNWNTTVELAPGVSSNFCRTSVSTGLAASNSSVAFQIGAGVSFTVSGWYKPFASPVGGELAWCKKWRTTDVNAQEFKMGCSQASGFPYVTVRDLAGTAVSVTNNSAIFGADFNHVVFGYDNASGTIWIQLNNSPRTNAACNGVRAATAWPFVLAGGAGSTGFGDEAATYFDELGFWKRTLTTNEVSRLYGGGWGLIFPFKDANRGTQLTRIWSERVQNAGGAAPAAGTVTAIGNLLVSMMNSNIARPMTIINAFAPDNLTAAITPVLQKQGTTSWANTGFVIGDLSVNGLKGNGVGKFLDVGALASSIWAADTTCGVTCYISDSTGAATYIDIGTTDSTAKLMEFVTNDGGNVDFDCYNNTAGQGRITWTTSATNGYYGCNRTSASATALYFANSGVAHSAVASAATTGGNRPVLRTMYVFGQHSGLGLELPSANRYSFVAFHDGLTSAESLAFFNCIQAYRTAIGGGFQ